MILQNDITENDLFKFYGYDLLYFPIAIDKTKSNEIITLIFLHKETPVTLGTVWKLGSQNKHALEHIPIKLQRVAFNIIFTMDKI